MKKKLKKAIKAELNDSQKVYTKIDRYFSKLNEKYCPLGDVPDKIRDTGDNFICFGKKDGYPVGLKAGLDGHGAVFGGSGKGKTSKFAVPTLLTWKGAMICTDIKGEMSDWYRFFRCKKMVKRKMIVFDPEDENCPRYDPFVLIDKYPNDKIAIISSIVLILIPTKDGAFLEYNFWTKSAQTFLKAALLYRYNCNDSFIDAIKYIQTTSITELLHEIKKYDAEASEIIGDSIEKNVYLLSSIDIDIHNALEVFCDPYISKAFDRDSAPNNKILTWDMVNTYNIFLKLPSEKIIHWKPVFNIMYSQLIFTLNKRKEKYSYGGENNMQTLLLMDEFASFGKIPGFEKDISTLRSKSVNIFIILQSLAQLDRIYGEDIRKEIMDNCCHNLILGCNDNDTRKYFSELIGTHDELKFSLNTTFSNGSRCLSRTVMKEKVVTIEPHELGALEDIIVISEGHPYRLEKFELSPKLYREYKVLQMMRQNPQIMAIAGRNYYGNNK